MSGKIFIEVPVRSNQIIIIYNIYYKDKGEQQVFSEKSRSTAPNKAGNCSARLGTLLLCRIFPASFFWQEFILALLYCAHLVRYRRTFLKEEFFAQQEAYEARVARPTALRALESEAN